MLPMNLAVFKVQVAIDPFFNLPFVYCSELAEQESIRESYHRSVPHHEPLHFPGQVHKCRDKLLGPQDIH